MIKMGCDIHAFIEVKFGGAWHYYGELKVGRDYELFERMAGVRGYKSAAMLPPRGLPEDAGAMTVFIKNDWGSDGHSHSWFSAVEMEALDAWHKKRFLSHERPASVFTRQPETLYLFGNDIDSWWRWPRERPKGVEDIRLVFWFDN